MIVYLVVTIDVEPDSTPTWHYADPLGFRGVLEGIGDILQPMFNSLGVVPTYLVNNVVMEDPACCDFFGRLKGNFELGAHLHPEFIEPDKKFYQYAGKKGEANCCFYPPGVEFEKIQNITLLFERAFGRKPTTFRAGRYSAGLNTMKSLERLGYLVDTSVTPHVCWNDRTRERPVDFSDAPEQPYFMQADSISLEAHRGDLLEIPISINLEKRNPVREWIVSAGGLRRPFRKTRARWLRPYYSNADQLKGVARQFMDRYRQRERVALNMMFHNVEVLPGLSPYNLTSGDTIQYLNELKDFLSFCKDQDILSVSATDLYHVFKN